MTPLKYRLLIIFYWLLIIAVAGLTYFDAWLLPQPLKSYVESQYTSDEALTTSEIIIAFSLVAYLALAFLTSIGLDLFQKWAKQLFFPIVVVGLVITLFVGPHVESGPLRFITSLCSCIDGVILALTYYSPIRERFNPGYQAMDGWSEPPPPPEELIRMGRSRV